MMRKVGGTPYTPPTRTVTLKDINTFYRIAGSGQCLFTVSRSKDRYAMSTDGGISLCEDKEFASAMLMEIKPRPINLANNDSWEGIVTQSQSKTIRTMQYGMVLPASSWEALKVEKANTVSIDDLNEAEKDHRHRKDEFNAAKNKDVREAAGWGSW